MENVVGCYNALDLEHTAPPTHACPADGGSWTMYTQQLPGTGGERHLFSPSARHSLSQCRQKQQPALLPTSVEAVTF